MTESDVDKARIEKAVREILEAIGEDPDRDGLVRTPQRVAEMYAEIFAGLHLDPCRHLGQRWVELQLRPARRMPAIQLGDFADELIQVEA